MSSILVSATIHNSEDTCLLMTPYVKADCKLIQ